MSSISSRYYDVIIIGAGASGLMCAMTAGQQGRKVLVLEKANKVGKKILMSGGGRCNFTNHFVEADNFISQNPHFCISALKRYTQWDFIAMVEQHGIDYEERSHSQLFCKHSAKDILTMLLDECQQVGVEIHTDSTVSNIQQITHQTDERSAGRYHCSVSLSGQSKTLKTHSLVVATGALSIPSLGGSGFGYELAQQFSLPLVPRQAGLVPFMFSDQTKLMCERLSGLALEVEASCNGRSFTENVLFTHRGMSGPVMLQISNYWAPGDSFSIDLFPGLDVASWLVNAKQRNPKSLLRTFLTKKLAKNLVAELQALFWPKQADLTLAEFNDKLLTEIGQQLNHWVFKPSATEGYRKAEVTLGGVDTQSISSKTMEVKDQAGLFFVGEVLDVTGHLGGYNFQWAWSSGYTAGLFV